MSDTTPVKRGPMAWMVEHRVAPNLLMLLFIIGGIFMTQNIQKEVFPEFQLDTVSVTVAYPGATPEEVETGVVLALEEAVSGLDGIDEIRSTANEGSGSLTLEILSGADRQQVYQDVLAAVGRITTLPAEAEQPRVSLNSHRRDVVDLQIHGDLPEGELYRAAERVRERILESPAITQAELEDVRSPQIHIDIPDGTLRAHGLTLAQVSGTIAGVAIDRAGGSIRTQGGEILLRVTERREWAEEFADIVVAVTPSGGPLRLGDIATIREGFEDVISEASFNGERGIGLAVYRVEDQTPISVSEAVHENLPRALAELPPGVDISVRNDSSEIYAQRLGLLMKNGFVGLLLVLLLLSIFLEFKLAFWVTVGIPTAFLGAFLFLPGLEVSINMVSMFAFIIALGIVVDDAIVAGENIYEYRQRGMGNTQAAIQGARDIAKPISFSILTNIVAFLPLLFIPGIMGQYWSPMPMVVITVLALSLLEALFILPSHLAHIRERSHAAVGETLHGVQRRFSRGFSNWVDTRYKPFLERCVRQRYVTLTSAVVLLAVTGGYAMSDHIGMIMMPQQPADEIEAGVRLPVGTTRDVSAEMAARITEATYQMFEDNNLHEAAEGIKTNVWGRRFIDVEIVLLPPAERDITTQEVIELWRDQIGDIKGVDQITFEAERGPGSWRDDISIDLSHSDITVLERAATALVERLEEFADTRDVNDNYDRGKAQLDFTLLPEGQALGLTPVEVGRQLRGAFFGDIAMRYLRGTNEIEVRVRLPEKERDDIQTLETFMLRTSNGVEVPLADVARIETGQAFTSINRRDGRRIINVGTDVEPKTAVTRVLAAVNDDVLPQLRADFPGITWTFEGSQAELRESTAALWGGFGLALFAVYALLAIAFGSYIQPLIVMLAIPFGIVGGILGHILLGYDLSLVSMLGVVAVSGVVINGALIMVHYANRQRAEMSAEDAIIKAGARRFRPIMLTTITTFGGLAPIILETSIQAAALIPMAISLGFGILFATTIMLVVVPCFYMMIEDIQGLLERRRAALA